MHLTIRLENGNYIDLEVDMSKRCITFLSGVPNTNIEDLMQIADEYNCKFLFPITEDIITPDDESEQLMEASLPDVLTLICTLMNLTVSEY